VIDVNSSRAFNWGFGQWQVDLVRYEGRAAARIDGEDQCGLPEVPACAWASSVAFLKRAVIWRVQRAMPGGEALDATIAWMIRAEEEGHVRPQFLTRTGTKFGR
jgi:hypothetical protein